MALSLPKGRALIFFGIAQEHISKMDVWTNQTENAPEKLQSSSKRTHPAPRTYSGLPESAPGVWVGGATGVSCYCLLLAVGPSCLCAASSLATELGGGSRRVSRQWWARVTHESCWQRRVAPAGNPTRAILEAAACRREFVQELKKTSKKRVPWGRCDLRDRGAVQLRKLSAELSAVLWRRPCSSWRDAW